MVGGQASSRTPPHHGEGEVERGKPNLTLKSVERMAATVRVDPFMLMAGGE